MAMLDDFWAAALQNITDADDDDTLFELVAYFNRYARLSADRYVGPRLKDGTHVPQAMFVELEAIAMGKRTDLANARTAAAEEAAALAAEQEEETMTTTPITGTVHVADTRSTVPYSEPITPDFVRRVTVTTNHAAASHGLPVLVGDSGRVYGPADLPSWAVLEAVEVDADPSDPQPAFSLDLDSPWMDWLDRAQRRRLALLHALVAASYPVRDTGLLAKA